MPGVGTQTGNGTWTGSEYAICWTASATMVKEGGPFWACL